MQNEFGIYSSVILLVSFQLKGKEKELGLQLSDSGKVRCLHTLNVKLSVPREGNVSGQVCFHICPVAPTRFLTGLRSV